MMDLDKYWLTWVHTVYRTLSVITTPRLNAKKISTVGPLGLRLRDRARYVTGVCEQYYTGVQYLSESTLGHAYI